MKRINESKMTVQEYCRYIANGDKKYELRLIKELPKFVEFKFKGEMTPEEFVNAPLNKADQYLTMFENWMKKHAGIKNIHQNFSNDYVNDVDKMDGVKGKGGDSKYDRVSYGKINGKTSYYEDIDDDSSAMTDQSIIDWIGEELQDAIWCSAVAFDDYEPVMEIETDSGDRFEVSIKKI